MNDDAKAPGARAVDTALSVLIVFGLLIACFQILAPFLWLVVWGLVIAIAVNPLFLKLCDTLGGRQKLAAGIFVIAAFVLIIIPVWSFTSGLLGDVAAVRGRVEAGTLAIPAPSEAVRDWPVIGERAYGFWDDASTDLSEFLEEHHDQVRSILLSALAGVANVGLSALQFLVSTVIAVALMLSSARSTPLLTRLFIRFSPAHGESLVRLTVATIRSVAVGVLGIAAIQALLAGLGIAIVGLPAVGIWSLAVLLLAIAQLPPIIVLLPLSIYVFATGSTTVAVIFLIWNIIVSFSDAALKPMLLGRGVDAPMLVILIGAIGGMIGYGVVGLFIGAVVLAVGYKLFEAWLDATPAPAPDTTDPTTASNP